MLPTGRNIPPWKHGNTNFEEAAFSSYIIFFESGTLGSGMNYAEEGRRPYKEYSCFFFSQYIHCS